MRNFLRKLAPFVVVCLLLSVVLPVVLDPYNVFHYRNIRGNGVEPNKNYVKTCFILENPDRFNAYLFGSSRVGGIDVERLTEWRCYNMTYSVGLPAEHLSSLEIFLMNGIVPSMVLMGIDDISCFVDPQIHNKDLLRRPAPKDMTTQGIASFLLPYCSPQTLLSLPIMLTHKGDDQNYRERFHLNDGRTRANDLNPEKPYDWEQALPALGEDPYINRTEQSIAEIQSIIDLCDKYNIRLIIFSNPLHIISYQKSVKNGYLDFLYRLSDITEYYNFSGINDVTTDNSLYLETSHYKMAVGDMIIDAIFNNQLDEQLLAQGERLLTQGFGYYVTRENRDALFTILKNQTGEKNAF